MSSTKVNLKVSNNSVPSSKSNRGKKVVVLKLQPDLLKRFSQSQTHPRPSNMATAGNLNFSKPATSSPLALSIEVTDTDMPASDNVSTTPSQSNESPMKSGTKRSISVDGVTDRPRAKAKAKKTSRVEDLRTEETATNGVAIGNGNAPVATSGASWGASTSHHGLNRSNPRTNQGAINAQLRALDRTGTPCRKWAKSAFQLKSFTGVSWTIPSWTAPVRSSRSNSSETDGAPDQGKQDSEAASVDASPTTSTVTGIDDTMPHDNLDKTKPTTMRVVTS